jgi:hypothetical protein
MTCHRILPASATPDMVSAAIDESDDDGGMVDIIDAALSASPEFVPDDAFFEGMARAAEPLLWDQIDKYPKERKVVRSQRIESAKAVWSWQAAKFKEGV